MLPFQYQNPTLIIFGKGEISSLAQQIPAGAKVLLTYGAGSIKTNGVYDQVVQALEGHTFIEFSGIESNPDFDTLMKAVTVVKAENIDFLLAVGGESVLDGTKFIAAAAHFEGDPWEMLAGQLPILPLLFPRFSILDPQTTLTLSPRQTANGVIDAFVHTIEQYLTYPVNAPLQDRLSESLLLTLIEEGPNALYEAYKNRY